MIDADRWDEAKALVDHLTGEFGPRRSDRIRVRVRDLVQALAARATRECPPRSSVPRATLLPLPFVVPRCARLLDVIWHVIQRATPSRSCWR